MKKGVILAVGFLMVWPTVAGFVHAADNASKNTLGLSWNILSGNGQFSTPSQKKDIPASGFMVEIEKRNTLETAPGLYYSIAPAFFLIAGSNSFNLPVTTPLAYTQHWSITTAIAGTAIMAKYGYNCVFGSFQVDLQNGFGLGYFIERDEWSWSDTANSDNHSSGSGNGDSFEPLADLSLTLRLAVSEISSLGLTFGGILTTFNTGNYTHTSVTKVGLNYQVRF